MAAGRQLNRLRQQLGERIGGRDKSDRLTEKLMESEKKMEGIRNGCQVTCKKLHGCAQGSGSSFEKHQKKLPQYSLGTGMVSTSRELLKLGPSVFGNMLRLVGQGHLEISQHVADHEIYLENEVIQPITAKLEEDMKRLEKLKKKLHHSRLDMDSSRNKYQAIQDKFSPKAESLKTDYDQAMNHFEQCQDAYATELFAFLSQEKEFAEKIHKMVILQITRHKQALAILEGVLPHLDNELDQTNNQPVYGLPLEQHLDRIGQPVSMVIHDCCLALREKWMDTEGIFRIAAGAAKLKLLKNSLDAGNADLSVHDPHTIAGALKMYLRELPDPILTRKLYTDWVKAAGVADEQDRMQQLWQLKEKLPKPNLENLKFLMFFLNELSKHQDETKMGINNIAIVIGPNLLWPDENVASTTFGFIGDTALHTRITESFIKHCSWYFGLAPSLYTSALDSKTSSSSSQQEREDEEETIQTREEDEDKESIRSAEVVSPTEHQTEEDENGDRESPTNSTSSRPSSFTADPTTPVIDSPSQQHLVLGTTPENRPTPPKRRRPPPSAPGQAGQSPKTPTGVRPVRRAPVPPARKPKPVPPTPPPYTGQGSPAQTRKTGQGSEETEL